MDIIEIVLDLPEKLADLAATLQSWIFDGITIGDYTLSFWGLLGGALITIFIIASIVGAARG